MRGKQKRNIETFDCPEEFMSFALRRCDGFAEAAILRAKIGGMDSVQNMIASAYLQGVADGAQAIERCLKNANSSL